MKTIDGSKGGGAVVRVAVGLAAARQQPVRITDIRAARPNPGLQHQHLAGINAVADLTNASVQGAEIGSTELVFQPETVDTDTVRVDVPTAGAVGLVLQPLQIAAVGIGQDVSVTIDGGATAGKWAPPIDYVRNVTGAMLGAAGVQQDITVERHGFYPEGGALTKATVVSGRQKSIDMTKQGDITAFHGVSRAATQLQDADVAERQRKEARRVLKNTYPSAAVNIETQYVNTRSPGSVITLWAEQEDVPVPIGADALGEKGKRSETVGREAAERLLDEIEAGAPVDRWLSDQLIPVLGLVGGRFTFGTFTDHMEHNVGVVAQLVDKQIGVDRESKQVTVS